MKRLTSLTLVILLLAACSAPADPDDPTDDNDSPPASTPSGGAPVLVIADGSPGDGPGLTVAEALTNGPTDDLVTVTGAMFVDADGTVRLCDAIAESFPPQCGGDRIVVEGLDLDDVAGIQEENDVRWAESVDALWVGRMTRSFAAHLPAGCRSTRARAPSAIIDGHDTHEETRDAPGNELLGLSSGPDVPWEYAPAPEATDHIRIEPEYGLFIGNEFRPSKPRKTFTVINPATEEPLAKVAHASKADVNRAVGVAHEAHRSVWSKLPGRERAKFLYRIARILQERSREFAVVESMNSGKPIKESRDVDVPLAAAHFFYYAGWADKLEYAFPNREPRSLGVAAQVIPWNFPLLMLAWKIAPALAAGNTVILKPASTTPLTAYLFADVVRQAELPPGVVNIITGPGEIGMELVTHPDVSKVAFTGSTAVGKMIARALAGTGKKVTLELGGKAANIVFDDAPLDQAIEGIINGIYFNQGEVCCAGSRLFVQESVYEPLIDKLKARLGTLRVGDPLDKNTDVGAINSAGQLAKVQELVESGIAEGAEIFQPDCELPTRGFFFRPTLFTGVSQSHRIAQEEIFGPVLSVLTFRTPEEAVEKANNTPYGLSAGVWTEKGSRIFKMIAAMKAGVVWANTFNRFDPTSPFGGYKESGYGREGGIHGLGAYLDLSGNGRNGR